MKRFIPTLATVLAMGMFATDSLSLRGAEPTPAKSFEDGVALGIVYDTSGSMNEPVAKKDGGQERKFLIANRALAGIIDRLEQFRQGAASGSGRKVQAGLVMFANGRGRVAVPFGPFQANHLRQWLQRFSGPQGNTPLGDALQIAGQQVLDSSLSRKHVLVLTDGLSNSGPAPAEVLRRLQARAAKTETVLGAHFVAFDVAAKVFDPLKKLGATVVSAADERQLNTQLEFILEKKILLEDEESAAPRGTAKP